MKQTSNRLCSSKFCIVWTGSKRTWELAVFSTFARVYVAIRTLKCSATHPAFSPVRNISRLFYVIFLLCQNQFQSRHSRRKWRPLTAWTLGRRISQLIAGESTWRSGACFGTFLRLRFQSSLRQVRDEDSKENGKKKRPTHPSSSFAFREIPWGILFLRLLKCMDFVGFLLSFGVLLSESLPELTPES